MSTAPLELVADFAGQPAAKGTVRPLLTNTAHRLHHRTVSAIRKDYRTGTATACAHWPHLDAVTITAWGRYPNGKLPDADAIAPSVKGIIDGLVDAGVIRDDSGDYVRAITYRAAVHDPGCRPAVVVQVAAVAALDAAVEGEA